MTRTLPSPTIGAPRRIRGGARVPRGCVVARFAAPARGVPSQPSGGLSSSLMRDLMTTIERTRIPWYITGSEALAFYGSPRQTMDVDVVLEASRDALDGLARTCEQQFYYAEPLRFGNRLMASLVDRHGAGKVDLIVRDPDAWASMAMARRRRWSHPLWGAVWVSSLEDLILAKLEWSGGTSELQLRDCAALLRMNRGVLDDAYLAEWAAPLDVEGELRQAREAAGDAS
jgi:hypothetical protein